MADKPSRGLVIYGDGLARFINESHSNLHSFASRGHCGFLSLPLSPPPENEDKRTVSEFLQLLDACDHFGLNDKNADEEYEMMTTLSERFMGMKPAIVTNNSGLKYVGRKLGLSLFQLSDLVHNSHPNNESSFDELVSKLLDWLGFQEGKASETSPFDIVFVHIGEKENNDEGVQFVNNLVGSIMHFADQGSEIDSRLHVSVVMSFGFASGDDDPNFSVLETKHGENSVFSLLFPQQSYTMAGRNLRHNVRHHHPMLIAQWQNGVTRKDLAEAFSFKDFKELGGMLTIPADRFIHEVAFKLWKAPKYGA